MKKRLVKYKLQVIFGVIILIALPVAIVVSQQTQNIFPRASETTTTNFFTSDKKACSSDTDCGCGLDVDSTQCAVQNIHYLSGTCTSPDFCSGIGGNLVPQCIDGQCKQIPTSITPNPISWSTPEITLDADDFYITANNKTFHANDPNINIGGDPGNNHYNSLELQWTEHDTPMRVFIYFTNDSQDWWSFEFRTYNGLDQDSDWTFYYDAPYFKAPLGQQYTNNNLTLNSTEGNTFPTTIHFSNLRITNQFGTGNEIARECDLCGQANINSSVNPNCEAGLTCVFTYSQDICRPYDYNSCSEWQHSQCIKSDGSSNCPFPPVPTVSYPPVCGNNICEDNEYVPCPAGATCIWAGSCPEDCTEDDIQQDTCAKARGTWEEFSNTCGDSCDLANNPNTICGSALTFSCNCGADKCWDSATSSCLSTVDKKACTADSDCGCGVDVDSTQCAVQNNNYLAGRCTWPDFCGGIGGNLVPKCIDNQCIQQINLASPGSSCQTCGGFADIQCQEGLTCAILPEHISQTGGFGDVIHPDASGLCVPDDQDITDPEAYCENPSTYSTDYNIADINQDGIVDITDYSILVSQFFQTGDSLSADLNGDRIVDISDYSILVSNFFETGP